jgi:hypothetical protein
MTRCRSDRDATEVRPVPRALAFMLLVAAMASSGASCPQVLRGYQVGTMPLPRALPPQATLEQAIATVHDNTQRVRSLMASQALLVVPGVPRLSARMACEPPRRFRLQAQTSLTGPELDIGSNDDLFWLWLRQHQPPIIAFCAHDRAHESAARRLLPIRADWLPELVGLVGFRPEDDHQGPFPTADGRLEIRSRITAPDGELFKSTILDGTTGIVAEQHLFSAAGERIASVRTSRHRVDPGSGAALPHLVEVSWPASQVEFKLEVTSYTVNMPAADPAQLWQMPAYPGYEPIDLADPSVVVGPPPGS